MGTDQLYATNYRGTGNLFIDADTDPTVLVLWHEIFGEVSSLMAEPRDLSRKDSINKALLNSVNARFVWVLMYNRV